MASIEQISVATANNSAPEPVFKQSRRFGRIFLLVIVTAALLSLAWFYALRIVRSLETRTSEDVPTAAVKRGDVSLTIAAKGELRGGNPQMLAAPRIGGTEMHITELRRTGELVQNGDIVVAFDTSEQEFKLREAESDLAEAEQNVSKAKAQREADEEEDRYALLKAKADLALAELDVRKNPLLSTIAAKQNDLALRGAQDHLEQTVKNINNHKATGEAGVIIQDAARAKALSQAATARENIRMMTLRATRTGYVAIRPNTSTNFYFTGMTLPFYQSGDSVRPGMAVAEIPDLNHWEIVVNVGEQDRGHLELGNKVEISIVAVPGQTFHGSVKEVGGMTGSFWERHAECKIALDDPDSRLRPGMSANVIVTTDRLKGVLSLPSQAVFESDGKIYAYVRSGETFVTRNLSLIRRNETRAVVEGLKEGEIVALANPIDVRKKKSAKSPLESVGK